MYVSNFFRIPVRSVTGMNIGSVRPLTPKALNPDGVESELLLHADEGPIHEKGEGNSLSPLFAESIYQRENADTGTNVSRLGTDCATRASAAKR